MISTHATKNRVRYRYYISQPLQRGNSNDPIGTVARVLAEEIETLITKAVRDRLLASSDGAQSFPDQETLVTHIARVEVRTKQLAITIKASEPDDRQEHRDPSQRDELDASNDRGEAILIPWTKPPMRKFRDVIQPAYATSQHRTRPIRSERRAGLIRAIARGRQWLSEIVSGRFTIEDIAARQKCSARQINLTLSIAFLAPPLVKAAIEGRLPRGIGIAQLRDAPPEWSRQCERLGLSFDTLHR